MDIPRQAKDIIQRVLIRTLRDAVVAWHGLDVPPIVEELSPDLARVTIRQMTADAVFRTEDGAILHIEFQSQPVDTLERFLEYAVALTVMYHAAVRTVVVYLGPAPHAPAVLDRGAVRFSVRNVLVAERDGDATWERLVAHAAAGTAWTPTDLLDLAFLPFMRAHASTQVARAVAAAKLAETLPDPWRLSATALLVGISSRFLDRSVLQSLKEVLRMNELIRMIEEEGRTEGRTEGQVELLWVMLIQRWGPLPAEVREKLATLAATPGAAGQLATLGNLATRDELLRRLELT